MSPHHHFLVCGALRQITHGYGLFLIDPKNTFLPCLSNVSGHLAILHALLYTSVQNKSNNNNNNNNNNKNNKSSYLARYARVFLASLKVKRVKKFNNNLKSVGRREKQETKHKDDFLKGRMGNRKKCNHVVSRQY